MAIRPLRSRRPITGPLHATPTRPIRTGCSSRQAAADPRWRQRAKAALAACAAGALALLAVSLDRDSGPTRFSLTPAGSTGFRDGRTIRLRRRCRRFSNPALGCDAAGCGRARPDRDSPITAEWEIGGALCQAAEALPPGDDAAARRFFEVLFIPLAVADYGEPEGLFTGYFEIELNGSRRRHGRFQTPIYRRPPELGAGRYSAPRSRTARSPDAVSNSSGSTIRSTRSFWRSRARAGFG